MGRITTTSPCASGIGIASALMLGLLLIPLLALTLRALGDLRLSSLLFEGSVLQAMILSLMTTTVSMFFIVLLGTPLAYAFARYNFPLKRPLNVLVELPIVLPPVVAGLALLMAFGRRGLLGSTLALFGISIPFTPAAIILAQIFVSSPFYIRSVQNRFGSIPAEIEEAAGMDGAGSWRTFRNVTLPLSRHAIFTGLVLAWARALGEFGANDSFCR